MSLELFNLSGKVAVFIGGGGGLGQAVSLGLANAGADIIPVGRSAERNADLVRQIEEVGRKSLLTSVDITDENDIKRLVDQVINKFGRIDILINAAGKNYKKPALQLSQDEWDDVFKVNAKGVFTVSQVVGERMIAQGGGKIINFASLGSHLGITRSVAYCASKGAVLQMTKVLAAEWAPYGVNVNSISPGYFQTPLTEKMLSEKETYDKIIARTPMQRLGQPQDLVGAVIFLASDASNFVTGTTIAVDGGFLSLAI